MLKQIRGFKVGVAFQFEKYVMAFLTLDNLVQVCSSVLIQGSVSYLKNSVHIASLGSNS